MTNRSFTEKGERNIVRYGYLNGSEDAAVDGSKREERIAELLTALEQVWSDLVAADVRPEFYLEGLNGKLNPGTYWFSLP